MQIYYPLSPVLPTLLVKLHAVVMEEQSFGSAGLTIKMAAIKAALRTFGNTNLLHTN